MAEEKLKKETCETEEDTMTETEETTASEEQEVKGEQDQDSENGDEKNEHPEKKDPKDELIEELNDRVRRQLAEFDNFRKRSEKEKSGMFEMGAKSVVEQLLPIVDNFERGLAVVPEEKKDDPFIDGMDKIYRQMTEMLDKIGVKAIEALGCEFNPDFHNAVMHVEDENEAENTIVEEFLKGYTYKDHVVRHSMVKVAN